MDAMERARAISAELDRWWAEDVAANPWPEITSPGIRASIDGGVFVEATDEDLAPLRAELAAALAAEEAAYEVANAARNARWEAHRVEFVLELDGG